MSNYAAAVAAVASQPLAYASGKRAGEHVKVADIAGLLAGNEDTITMFIVAGQPFNVAFYIGFAETLQTRA